MQIPPLTWFDSNLADRLILTLAHFLWQGIVIGVVVWCCAAILQRASSHLRYVGFLAALMLMAACPVVTFLLVELPPRDVQQIVDSGARIQRIDDGAARVVQGKVLPGTGSLDGVVPAERSPDTDSSKVLFTRELAGTAGDKTPSRESSSVTSIFAWHAGVPYAVAAYLFGVLVFLARLLIGLHGGWNLQRRSVAIANPQMMEAIASRVKALGMRSAPAVRLCRDVAIPTVVGVIRPAVLLPVSLATGLTADQIDAILTHELAHIRRFDHLVNLLQRVIESLLFFHPAVWWVSQRIRVERENCCDDVVVALGAEPVVYAESLLNIAEKNVEQGWGRRHASVTLSATGRRSQLGQRIRRLLGAPVQEPLRLTRLGVVTVLIGLGLGVVGIALMYAQAEFGGIARKTEQNFTDVKIRYKLVKKSAAQKLVGRWRENVCVASITLAADGTGTVLMEGPAGPKPGAKPEPFKWMVKGNTLMRRFADRVENLKMQWIDDNSVRLTSPGKGRVRRWHRVNRRPKKMVGFGPVVERVVGFDPTKKKSYLDLETGRYVAFNPLDKKAGDSAAIEKVDIATVLGESDMRVRYGWRMVAIPVGNERWKATVDEVRQAVEKAKPQRQVRLGVPPQTYFIKTRQGSIGVLQLTKFIARDSAVKVRYKLLRRGGTPGEKKPKSKLPAGFRETLERLRKTWKIPEIEKRRQRYAAGKVRLPLDVVWSPNKEFAVIHGPTQSIINDFGFIVSADNVALVQSNGTLLWSKPVVIGKPVIVSDSGTVALARWRKTKPPDADFSMPNEMLPLELTLYDRAGKQLAGIPIGKDDFMPANRTGRWVFNPFGTFTGRFAKSGRFYFTQPVTADGKPKLYCLDKNGGLLWRVALPFDRWGFPPRAKHELTIDGQARVTVYRTDSEERLKKRYVTYDKDGKQVASGTLNAAGNQKRITGVWLALTLYPRDEWRFDNDGTFTHTYRNKVVKAGKWDLKNDKLTIEVSKEKAIYRVNWLPKGWLELKLIKSNSVHFKSIKLFRDKREQRPPNPVHGLQVSISFAKARFHTKEPITVKWRIKNVSDKPKAILWHPLHYSPVLFVFDRAGKKPYVVSDFRRFFTDEIPASPQRIVLRPGMVKEATFDLRHFGLRDPSGQAPTGVYTITGLYAPKAKESHVPNEVLTRFGLSGVVLDRIESRPVKITVQDKNDAPAGRHSAENEAVTALQKLGARLEFHKDGLVKTVDLQNRKIKDDDLKPLAKLAAVRYVTLHSTGVTDAGLVYLRDLADLRILSLWNTKVSDKGLVHLKKLTKIRELNLGMSNVTGSGLVHLSCHKTLHWLNLGNGPNRGGGNSLLNDAGLAHLRSFTELRKLGLEATRITDMGMPHLSRLTKLTNLSIARTGVTNNGLRPLRSLVELHTLDITSTTISNAGLEHLKVLPKLRVLYSGNTRVTLAATRRLLNLYLIFENREGTTIP